MKAFIFSTILAISGYNLANATPHWSGPISIDDIYVWDYTSSGNQNYINIRVTPFYNPENCTDQQGYQLTTATDPKYFERIYALVLTAYTTGQKVSFLIDGCAGKAVIKGVSFGHAQN